MKGEGGGGKRKSRRPTRVEPDDRPRGFEATRMRQLWRDIDHAKRKAGLGPVPDPAPEPSWDLAAMVEHVAALAGLAAAWVTANAPVALALVATGADLLRGVPIVGRLVDLVPLPGPSSEPPQPTRRGPEVNGHAGRNGHTPVLPPDDDSSNGKWIH